MPIRKATLQDVNSIFQLMLPIWDDMDFYVKRRLEPAVFEKFMLAHISQEQTKYSYQHVWVYETLQGEILAILLGYPGGKELALDQQLFDSFRSEFPQFKNWALDVQREATDAEWYLDSIIVAESERGKGIGKQFFAMLPELIHPHTHVGLNCEVSNIHAARLYVSIGFQIIDKIHFSGHDYFHMEKKMETI